MRIRAVAVSDYLRMRCPRESIAVSEMISLLCIAKGAYFWMVKMSDRMRIADRTQYQPGVQERTTLMR